MSNEVTVEGFVVRIFEKSGTNARGPWTAYSVKVASAEGVEDPLWYQFGFDKPPFQSDSDTDGSGDYIKFQATPKDDKAASYVKGSGEIVKNPPARQKAEKKSGGGSGRAGYSAAKTTQSDLFGEIGGYNTEDDIRRMSFSAARSAAVDVVTMLLANEALPLVKAKTPAATARRFDEITEAVDKLTVQYFYDAATGRLMDSVADAGAEGATKVAPLPDDSDEEPEGEETAPDAGPPADPDEEQGNRKF